MTSIYTTQYSYLSNRKLNSMFSQRIWYGETVSNGLSVEERRQLCQEVENRLASSRNEHAREVRMEPMNGTIRGYYEQSSNRIVLNEHCLSESSFYIKGKDFNGNETVRIIPVEGMNWAMLSTVYHEDYHGVQFDHNSECIDRAYMTEDKALYRIQGCEKEAKEVGYQAALNAIDMETICIGTEESSAVAFRRIVEADSFENALEEAKQRYDDENVESTLEQVARDRNYGVKPTEMTPSYARINEVYNQQARRQVQSVIEMHQPQQYDRGQSFQLTQPTNQKGSSKNIGHKTIVSYSNEVRTIGSGLCVDDGNDLANPQDDVYTTYMNPPIYDGVELTKEKGTSVNRGVVPDNHSLTEETSISQGRELHVAPSNVTSDNGENNNSARHSGYSSNSYVR